MDKFEIALEFSDELTEWAMVDIIPSKGHAIIVEEDDIGEDSESYSCSWHPETVGKWRVVDVIHESIGKWADGSTGVTLKLEKEDD